MQLTCSYIPKVIKSGNLYIISTVLKKDLSIEWESKSSINALLAFVGISFLMVAFTAKFDQLNPSVRSGLQWIIVLFAALTVLWRTYVIEFDRRTNHLLQLYVPAIQVWLSKGLLNTIFTFLVSVVTFLFFFLATGQHIESISLLLLTLTLASVSLGFVSTFLSMLIAESKNRSSLFAIISIPVLIPWMLLVQDLTQASYLLGWQDGVWNEIFALLGYTGALVSVSLVLIDAVAE